MKNTLLALKVTFIQFLLILSFSANSQCFIDFLYVEITACEGELFDVSIDFEYGNTSDQFTVVGNGNNYGTFNYVDLPITLTSLEADCATEFEFVVTDVNNNDCSDFLEWGTVCCDEECELWDLVLDPSECDGGDFQLTIDFNYQGNTSPTFDWEIVGVGSGTAFFADLPLTVFAYDAINDILGFVVTESNNTNCFIETSFNNPCYDPNLCFIGMLNISASECDNNEYSVEINFDYENTSDEFFLLLDGDEFGTYNYTELPITIDGLESNCNGNIVFEVYDSEFNGTCFTGLDFETICCEDDCEILSIDFGPNPECVDGFIVTEWFIFGENTSEVGYDIFINGDFYTFVQYNGNGPYDFDIEDPGTEFFTIAACDNDNPDCCYVWEVENPCYDPIECDIFDLVIETGPCDNGFFEVVFDFEYSGTTNNFFDWVIPGVDEGTAEFDDLPISLAVENTTTEIFELIINENDNPNCVIDGTFENPCFTPEECFIGELDVEVSECDGNMFFVVINFDYENTSDQFTVNGNGNNYGTFLYSDLPITIDGLESDCDLQYEFVVQDVEFQDCASDIGIGEVCCEGDCEIFSIDFGPNPECVDGFIVTEWYIFGENTSEVGFDIFINNEFYIFVQYDGNGPYDFDIEDPGTEFFTIKACDNDNPDCCYSWELENPCFDPVECELFDLVIETSECDGGFFEVTFDFDYTGTTNNFFDWEIPGEDNGFAEFSDLPLTVLIENSNTNGFDLFINENDNPDCAIEGSFENPCFNTNDCFIGELDVEVSECDGNFFFVSINFEYENTSNQFTVAGNGNNYGTFTYVDLPIIIDGLESDCGLDYEFVVQDAVFNDCASDVGIGEVCCDEDCEMITLDFGANPICEEGLIVTEWLIDGEGISEVGYDIFINDEFEIFVEYNDSDWYDFAIENPGTEYFNIKACDNDNPDCCIEMVEILNPCFDPEECDLFDLVIETGPCDNGFFEVVFDFEYTGTTNDFFDWEIPGIDAGTSTFANLPISLAIENTSTNVFELIINENDNPDCAIDGSFENPCFETEDCFIGELDIEASDCEDNMFYVVINFDYHNTSDEFFVNANGENYGPFLYANLPIEIGGLESNCDVPYEFLVYDSEQNGTCESDANIGIICCDEGDCFIGELDVEVSECDGNFFFVTINFEYENTSDQFTVAGNGNNYGTFSYADLPIVIDGLESDCDLEYEFVVHDVEFNDCVSDVGIGEVCCEEEDCEIVSIDFGPNPICEGGFIVTEWFIFGENTSEVGYDIFINNEFYTFVQYNGNGPYNFDIENPGTQNFAIKACDNDNEDCCYTWELANPCFEGEECDLFDLNFDVSECDGDLFIVEVDFEYTGNTFDSFVWEIPGIASGTALFEDLPITIEIENTTESQFTFFANEVENQDCDIVGTFGNPCYDDAECVIDGVTAEVIVCEDDLFDVEIDFEYDNEGSTFSILGNGVEYGTYEYSDLPVIITGLEANCTLEYEFVVMDNENEGCSDFVEIGTICCEDFNQINGAQSETIIDGNIFNVTFDITNTTLKGCKIEVYIDGELYETLGDDETLFTMGPFDCGQEEVLEIRMINTCSDAEWTIMFDLSEIECITDVNVTLDAIDLKWNMVDKILSLDGEVPVTADIQLINAQGSLILAENGVKIGWSRDLNGYPSGLYFVRIVDNNSDSSQGLIKKILIP